VRNPLAAVSRWDVFAAAVALGAAVSIAAIIRFYKPPPVHPLFPRSPSEFLSPPQLADAKARAGSLLAKDPQDISALTELAVLTYQEGPDHALDCIEYAQKALDAGALDDRLFFYRGASYEAKGLTGYAAEDFEKFLRHHPDDLEVRLRLGNLLYRAGELEKAEAAFKAVLAARPADPLVSFNLAVVLRDRRQWEEGLAVLLPIMDRDKTLPVGGQRVLGDLYGGAGKTDEALAAYRKELERAPDDADTAAAVADTLEKSGRKAEAREAWKHVLDIDKGNRRARARIRALTPRPARRARRR
jgi:tetratricopeptide (TPR) repeat protein